MYRSTISSTAQYKKLLVLLILPFTLFLIGAKWVEKPIDNLDTIVGKWKGGGINDNGWTFEVEYLIRKDGSFDGWAGDRGSWSTKTKMPPGTLKLKGGKVEYRNDKGRFRSGVLYEDTKGRRMLKFETDTDARWDVRQKKKR
jgi:hypothetical protein